MAISWDDFDKIWASTSPLTPYNFSEVNYKQGWNFVGATPPARQMWDSIQKANDEKFKFLRDNFGSPNMVTTAAQMTDTDKIYVYVGSEAGWNNGHWYYYDAGTSAWVDGGVYNSTAFVTDTTLTEAGKAADAKAVGDALALKADLAGATFTGVVNGVTPPNDDNSKKLATTAFVTAKAGNYLPLSGGTMTGWLSANANEFRIRNSKAEHDGMVSVFGGEGTTTGANLCLYGTSHSSQAGRFVLSATDGANTKSLRGQADGTLTWNNKKIATTEFVNAKVGEHLNGLKFSVTGEGKIHVELDSDDEE